MMMSTRYRKSSSHLIQLLLKLSKWVERPIQEDI